MDLEGRYEWITSRRTGSPAISFVLHSTRWIRDEHFDAVLIDATGIRPPKTFNNLCLEHGKSYRFDFDTIDWEWRAGDSFVITRRNGKDVNLKWVFDSKGPSEGECPECHGTHICSACNGRGHLIDSHHTIQTCQRCHGTGRCQTCYIPSHGDKNPGDEYKSRRVDTLRMQIVELREKIAKEEGNLRMMQRNQSTSSFTLSSQNQLLFTYQKQLNALQYELQQLEQER